MSSTVLSSAASSPLIQPPPSSSGESTTPTSPEDNLDPLADIRLLLQYVARAFYEARHILLFDQLIRKEAMKDEELATRLGIGAKELAKAANQLIRDQLVSVYLRAELKPGAHKSTQRTYYFIDYKHCVDVIKWRMWKMNKVLDDKQRNVIDGQGYVCPRCKKTYSTLDVSGLSMTSTSFLCEICDTPLNDNENDIEVQKNKDRMQRLNSQTTLIKKNLQKADKVIIPAFDIAKWVAVNMPLESSVESADNLAVATGGAKETAVTVQLAQEGDMEAKRRLQEQQAEAKRQANALPVWIAQSTVNGELTRAGTKEGVANQGALQTGVSFHDPTATENSRTLASVTDDIDYDAYFAKLQNQANPITSSSTLSVDTKSSPAGSSGSLTSPSQSQASSIGHSLKRPRPDSDTLDDRYTNGMAEATSNRQFVKKTKSTHSLVPLTPMGEDEDNEESEQTITIGGKLVALSEVTQQMENSMTPEEYTLYATMVMGG
ncbi:hypothetical protein O181_081879 [Austropuccinia psidii MF-1]|uniref:HTH TFE/IIEalpha-type domain-containing protein n=1 Tax=Austropuccinia psidii MF-1 TaxID=1389203 RepID=A0A9Q3FNM8_9BASI|nr:hypothetical protein [Austropuccinia psidii MF-1]